MTLLDAPTYDPAKARTRKNLLIAGLVACLLLAGFLWYFWDWPQEHRVNQFFAAHRSQRLCPRPSAFGITTRTGNSTRSNIRPTPTAASK